MVIAQKVGAAVQQVKQGDLLFRIDPRPYEANLAKAQAMLTALAAPMPVPTCAMSAVLPVMAPAEPMPQALNWVGADTKLTNCSCQR